MENINFVCKFCGSERKSKNSLTNHERLCKLNPNKQVSNFIYYDGKGHKGSNHFTKAKDLGLPIPESSRKGKYEKTYKCSICEGTFVGLKPYRTHLKTHKTDEGRDPKWSKFYGSHKIKEAKCKFCERIFTNSSAKTLHEKCCKNNPNRKEGTFKGKKHSEKTKKLISEKLGEVYKDKSIWRTQIEKRKSYAEQYFDNCFPELERNYHVDRYFLDLANPEKKLYIEIDGEQHYNDPKVVEHDKIRTAKLEEIGWKCLKRIRWRDFQKSSDEEKRVQIKELRTIII